MNNFRLKSPERNNYFYGKLLTVRDFQTEQHYFNQKIGLLNRFINGSGVAVGLQVTQVDNYTISIEPGIAIDYEGREIIIPSPITKKLSSIEGFPTKGYNKEVYLSLDYNEVGKEQVHSINNEVVEDRLENNEHNRMQETYKLSIKEELIDIESFSKLDLINKESTVFENNMIEIIQIKPKYARKSQVFDIGVIVKAKFPIEYMKLRYDLKLKEIKNLKENESESIEIELSNLNEGEIYKDFYSFKAPSKIYDKNNVFIENFELNFNEESIVKDLDYEECIEIIDEPIDEKIIKNYYKESVDEKIKFGNGKSVYLAKIHLVQAGPTFIIEKIDENPFKQRVYNNELLYNLIKSKVLEKGFNIKTKVINETIDYDQDPKVHVNFNNEEELLKFNFKLPNNKVLHNNISTGTIDVDVKQNFILGKNLYTDEIDHGLGLGPVCIQLGLEETLEEVYVSDEYSEQIYFGSAEAFYKDKYESSIGLYSLGAVAYPKKGTFRIAIRINSSNKEKKVRIRWWAYKDK